MKVLGLVYLAAGGTLATLLLQMLQGRGTNVGEMAMMTAIPNVITALLAVLFFRKSAEDATMHRVLLVTGYLAGMGVGTYMYYT